MKYLFSLAAHSAWNRRLTLGLVAFTIALSVAMLLGVERVRQDARESFTQSVAGTDLIVGARTSPVQLMLYAVFRIGEATSNIRWESFEAVARHPSVAWTVPLSLGDSHRGFPVLGTSDTYFEHYRYADNAPLRLAAGQRFSQLFEAVIGAEVAKQLGYQVGERISLSHGMEDVALASHGDKPFTVVGILERTGTPVDRTVHVGLESFEAIHLEWQGGARMPGLQIPAEHVRKFDLKPKQVSAVLVGLKSRAAVFRMQRFVNDYRGEPLLAVLPGVALDQLWRMIDVAERSLLLVSAMIVLVGLCGLVAVVLTGLNERRRELAILRSVGAQPLHVFLLLVIEGLLLMLAGTIAGVLLLAGAGAALTPLVETRFGISLPLTLLRPDEIPLLIAVAGVGLLASLIPGWRAYRLSLADGLTPRI